MQAKRGKAKRGGAAADKAAAAAPPAGGGAKAAASAPPMPPAAAAAPAKSRQWRPGRIIAAAAACLALLAALFIAGFGLFFVRTMRIERPPAELKAEAIIVLTGGRARLETGFALLRAGRGQRLLISGVSPIIRGRHNFAQILDGDPHLLECCVDLGWEALNTSGNAAESADWVGRRGYSKVLVVTNRYHMLRSLAELRHTMPQTELIPYPVDQAGGLFQSAENFRLFASEYVKFLVVSLRNIFG